MTVALVTGAASGLGLEFSKRLIADGSTVVMTDIDRDTLWPIALKLGGHPYVLDVSDAVQMNDVAGVIETEFGPLDLLVNNAGVLIAGDSVSLDRCRRAVNVNFMGVVNGCATFLPQLRETRGSILNVASLAGLFPAPELAVYSATKAAVIAYSEALSAELSGLVSVSVLCPSFTKTKLLTAGSFSDDAVDGLASTIMDRIGADAAAVASDGLRGVTEKQFMIVPSIHGRLLSRAKRTAPKTTRTATRLVHRLVTRT